MKVMDKEDILEQEMKEQIQEEVRIQHEMKHPNLVRLKEVMEDDCHLYVVLDHMLKGDLFDLLYEEHSAPLEEKMVKNIFFDMISGIQHLHSNHIIHRDIKLENLLMDDSGTVKITDFGAALDTVNCKNPDEFSVICGTREYMAPEMLKENNYDTKVDIWSCGVVLYELLHRGLPFESSVYKNKHKTLLKHILNNKISFSKKITGEAVDLLKQCLHVDPKKRITADQILKHPWLSKCSSEDDTRISNYNPVITHTKFQWLGFMQQKEDKRVSADTISIVETVPELINANATNTTNKNNTYAQIESKIDHVELLPHPK